MFLFSCDSNRVFEQNKRINNHKWSVNDTLSFVTTINDTSQFYDIYLNVRNGNHYPYNNLFLFINVKAPTGYSITDTLEITLADKTGKWYGNGLGDLSFLSAPYKQNIRFGAPGIYTFKIIHGMRAKNNELNEIYDVGLRVQLSPSNILKKP